MAWCKVVCLQNVFTAPKPTYIPSTHKVKRNLMLQRPWPGIKEHSLRKKSETQPRLCKNGSAKHQLLNKIYDFPFANYMNSSTTDHKHQFCYSSHTVDMKLVSSKLRISLDCTFSTINRFKFLLSIASSSSSFYWQWWPLLLLPARRRWATPKHQRSPSWVNPMFVTSTELMSGSKNHTLSLFF